MTPRQAKLLNAIIDDFIETANAVGSVTLSHKHRLGVSPATIRNEMANLVELGYLDKPHSSSGRVPTNMAFRYLIENILSPEDLEVETESNIYEQLFQIRFDLEALIHKALTQLATHTHNVALLALGERVYYTGLSNIVEHPEFNEQENLKTILSLLDNYSFLVKRFENYKGQRKTRVLVGEDIGGEAFHNFAVVFSDIQLHADKKGYVAVLGPNRMEYAKVIPVVSFISETLNKVISGW